MSRYSENIVMQCYVTPETSKIRGKSEVKTMQVSVVNLDWWIYFTNFPLDKRKPEIFFNVWVHVVKWCKIAICFQLFLSSNFWIKLKKPLVASTIGAHYLNFFSANVYFLVNFTSTEWLYDYDYTGCFFNWYPPKKLKYGKPRLGESTLT